MGPGLLELRWINTQERILKSIDRVALRLRPERVAPNLRTGILGERAALFELRRRGYTVVALRWSSPKAPGDIDIVAWQAETLCFLEVKSRTARDLTPAATAVDDQKRRTLRTLAKLYVAGFPAAERHSLPVRFDVVSVYLLPTGTEIEVVQAAFSMR